MQALYPEYELAHMYILRTWVSRMRTCMMEKTATVKAFFVAQSLDGSKKISHRHVELPASLSTMGGCAISCVKMI